MKKHNILKTTNYLFNISVILYILSFISCFLLLGYFNRHASDDFEFVNYVRDLGVIKATLRFYMEWEGAFTPILLENIIVGRIFPNDGSVFIFSLISLLIFIFSFYMLTTELMNKAFGKEKLSWFHIFITSMLFMGASYFITPDIGMIWHWMVGTITYMFSMCLLFICIAFTLRTNRTKSNIDLLIAIVAAFLFGATRFNIDAISFGFAILFIVAMYYFKKSLDYRFFIIFGTFVISFGLHLLAPGNYIRQDTELSRTTSDYTYLGELMNVIPRVSRAIFLNKLPYLLIFLSPLIIIGHKLNFNIKEAWNNPKRILILIIITIVILFIAVVANITSLYIAIERGDQAPRVWTLIVFMYVAAVASWFIIAGYVINKRYSAYLYIIAFLGIALSSYLFLKTAIVQYPIVSNYAKAYDERVYHLTQTNNEKLVNEGDTLFLKPLPSSGLLLSAEITAYPDNYINKAIMKRYNLPFYVLLNKEK